MLTLIERVGEHMTALRQSSPFAGVLKPAERWATYARFGLNAPPESIGVNRHDS